MMSRLRAPPPYRKEVVVRLYLARWTSSQTPDLYDARWLHAQSTETASRIARRQLEFNRRYAAGRTLWDTWAVEYRRDDDGTTKAMASGSWGI